MQTVFFFSSRINKLRKKFYDQTVSQLFTVSVRVARTGRLQQKAVLGAHEGRSLNRLIQTTMDHDVNVGIVMVVWRKFQAGSVQRLRKPDSLDLELPGDLAACNLLH